MTESFIEFLRSFGYPVRLRGYLMDADLTTDNVILWEETDSQSCMEYNNQTHGVLWTWTVHIISKSPTETINIAKEMKKESFYKPFAFQGLGSGYPIPNTEYYGRQLRFQAIERI